MLSHLFCRYYEANNGQKPQCLLVYRDGVSDSELIGVRVAEVSAIIEVRTVSQAHPCLPGCIVGML